MLDRWREKQPRLIQFHSRINIATTPLVDLKFLVKHNKLGKKEETPPSSKIHPCPHVITPVGTRLFLKTPHEVAQ
jgi:hypothetical protein